MKRRTDDVPIAFDDTAEAWLDLARVAPADAAEAGASAAGHLLLAFSHAVAAAHKAEARRVYDLFEEEDRAVVDRHEEEVPAEMKIWLTPD